MSQGLLFSVVMLELTLSSLLFSYKMLFGDIRRCYSVSSNLTRTLWAVLNWGNHNFMDVPTHTRLIWHDVIWGTSLSHKVFKWNCFTSIILL